MSGVIDFLLFAICGSIEHPATWVGYVIGCLMLWKEAKKWQMEQGS